MGIAVLAPAPLARLLASKEIREDGGQDVEGGLKPSSDGVAAARLRFHHPVRVSEGPGCGRSVPSPLQSPITVTKTVLIEIEIPFGKLEAAGEPEQINRTVCFRRAHVQGLNRGALGYAGLNAIGAEFLREAQVDAVVIERGARTTGAGAKRGRRPPPAAIPVELVLRAAEAIDLILRRGLAVA